MDLGNCAPSLPRGFQRRGGGGGGGVGEKKIVAQYVRGAGLPDVGYTSSVTQMRMFGGGGEGGLVQQGIIPCWLVLFV